MSERPWHQPSEPKVSLGMMFCGLVAIVPIDLFLVYALLDAGGRSVLAIVLAVVAFVGGCVLCVIRSPAARGFGIGMMLGWVVLTVVSGGVYTGLA